MTIRYSALLGICSLAAGLLNAEEPAAGDDWDVSTPPGDAREIDIDVRSGTWMSPDVSPDGSDARQLTREDFRLLNSRRTASGSQHASTTRPGAHWAGAKSGCTTATAARALGYEADLGTLEPGKLADLVVIDADILADIYQSDRVTHVMLNGRLYESATLNETVTGDRKTKPFYWQQR